MVRRRGSVDDRRKVGSTAAKLGARISRSQAWQPVAADFAVARRNRWPLFRAMDELAFHKMHGLGNDFVILDRRSGKLSLSAVQIRRIADRRLGVGAISC